MKKSLFLAIATIMLALTACSDSESYADLLQDENFAVNAYLANHRVIDHIPADTVFETGIDAPYYQMDEDGNVYMQVIETGDLDDRPEDDQLVYFRFLAACLTDYTSDEDLLWSGNSFNLDQVTATSFRYGNYSLESSYQWGSGLQVPMQYLGFNCEVYIVIKSQYGPTSLQSYVYPYVYHVRYYKSMI